MIETPEIVAPGTRVYADSGQFLEVTDMTAVGMHGKLFQTEEWAARCAKNKAAWAGRSWLRKWLGLPPKGYEPPGTPMPSIFGSLFGWAGPCP